jgi:uncharacterized protein
MKINVKRIAEEGEVFRGTEPVASMDVDSADIHFEQDIEYDLFCQVQGKALLVTGKLRAPAMLRCGRCLRMFRQPIKVASFVFHQELHGEDFVDLTPAMREDIILELPQRALCDPDCKGLCPSCGKDLNDGSCRCQPSGWDAHWQALDQLKLK